MHVAIIMDGNGRWAKARGMPRVMGHRAGAETARKIITHARERGISVLTLYAFSTENWQRSAPEVSAIMALLERYVHSEAELMRQNDIRLRVIGGRDRLSPSLRQAIREAEEYTACGTAMTLCLAVNYGGRDEIVRAARRLAERGTPPEGFTEQALGAALDTAGLPDPDLLIRTAGEQRVSNFLPWQAAYAELVFSPLPWPEFGPEALDAALAEYAGRNRTFGREPEEKGSAS